MIRMETVRSIFKILTGEPTGNSSSGTSRCVWEDKIRMDLIEMDVNTRKCIDSAYDKDYWRALVNAALNFLVP